MVINVGVDVDSILADYILSFTQVIESYYPGAPIKDSKDDSITTWDWHGWHPLSENEIESAWEDFSGSLDNLTAFYEQMPTLNDRGIASLIGLSNNERVNVYFITARHTSNPRFNVVNATRRWLTQVGFKNPQVLVTRQKGHAAYALGLNYFIDDNLQNILDVKSELPGCKLFLPDFPYNQTNIYGVTRLISDDPLEMFCSIIDQEILSSFS